MEKKIKDIKELVRLINNSDMSETEKNELLNLSLELENLKELEEQHYTSRFYSDFIVFTTLEDVLYHKYEDYEDTRDLRDSLIELFVFHNVKEVELKEFLMDNIIPIELNDGTTAYLFEY